jgi:hypothetical protein
MLILRLYIHLLRVCLVYLLNIFDEFQEENTSFDLFLKFYTENAYIENPAYASNFIRRHSFETVTNEITGFSTIVWLDTVSKLWRLIKFDALAGFRYNRYPVTGSPKGNKKFLQMELSIELFYWQLNAKNRFSISSMSFSVIVMRRVVPFKKNNFR